jgi:hypothetical protein
MSYPHANILGSSKPSRHLNYSTIFSIVTAVIYFVTWLCR